MRLRNSFFALWCASFCCRHFCWVHPLLMGNVYSFPNPPPGSVVIEIESRDCSAGCNQRQWDPHMRKPQQASAWSDGRWSEFSTEMSTQVRNFKRDGYAHLALLLIPVGILLLLVGLGTRGETDGFSVMQIIHVPFSLGAVLIFLAVNTSLRSANRAVDAHIEALCRRYADGAVNLQYTTQFTSNCKPKGARTYRALFISAGGGGGGGPLGTAIGTTALTTQMQVQCPPGCKPGDPLMIQAPGGTPMQVTVPDGVVPGSAFLVQVPAQPVMATAIVMPV